MTSTGAVVVVGGINLDTLARVQAPAIAATSNPGRTTSAAGGVGRNIAENLARLGTPVHLVGAVGCDPAGDRILDELAGLGVGTTAVRRRTDCATGTYTAVLDHDGSLLVGVADMSATEGLSPGDVPGDLVAEATWLVLDGNLRAETIAHCLDLAARASVPVAIDPVGVAKAARLGGLARGLGGVHTFTPNAAELVAWSGTDDEAAAIDRAHAQGVEVVWIRAGAAGSTLHRANAATVRIALPPAPVVDVTGAGDAMLAAYVHRLAGGADVVDAAWFATAAAWLTVGSPTAVHPDLTDTLVTTTLEEQRPR